ncbi:hypothetical protein B566_EDAN008106 [Ephemera danica]|nr:hypothetical protein B566_EDAN008106 [Ephemera danica]
MPLVGPESELSYRSFKNYLDNDDSFFIAQHDKFQISSFAMIKTLRHLQIISLVFMNRSKNTLASFILPRSNPLIDRIERFIDENKALMKRMYGEFQMTPDYGSTQSRGPGPELFETKRSMVKREAGGGPGGTNAAPSQSYEGHPGSGDSYFASQARRTRQSSGTSSTGPTTSTPLRNNQSSESGRLDACESKVEIVTPYWASNSAGKIRAIVNTQHFEQAIHQEVCSKLLCCNFSKVQTKRCSGDCGCEQKYKWHRLLAYDPDNDCKGIFMDWFLFPSCCVCRCDPFDGK